MKNNMLVTHIYPRKGKTKVSPKGFFYKEKDRSKKKIGTVVAVYCEDLDTIIIGCSKVNTTAGDKFNKAIGVKLALQKVDIIKRNIINNEPIEYFTPASFKYDIEEMSIRCLNYFKDKKLFVKLN
jgi:hypothetical protein